MTTLRDHDYLDLLFGRLLWPVPLVRLRAAQEIATLVKIEPTRSATVQFFIKHLTERKLESECSALLQIIDCWDLHPFFSQQEVGESISAHSLETFRILGDWPKGDEVAMSFAYSHSGTVHHGFEPSRLFTDTSKNGIPPIFAIELQNLQKKKGLPFFEQWAFEWEKLQDTFQFEYVGTVSYFLNPSWRQRQAQLDVMQHELLLSAYLRTLSCAVDEWGMPLEYASFYSAFALRANKTIAEIQPSYSAQRYLQLESYSEGKPQDEIANYCSTKMFASIDGFQILDFSMPLVTRDENRFLIVKGHTYLCSRENLDIDPAEIESLLDSGLKTTAQDPGWMTGNLGSDDIDKYIYDHGPEHIIPTCLSTYPIFAGRWLQDYLANGFNFPAGYLFEKLPLTMNPINQMLEFHTNGLRVGKWRCWHQHWRQSHHVGGKPNIGTESSISNEVMDKYVSENSLYIYFVIEIEESAREDLYKEYSTSKKLYWLKKSC